MIQNVNEPSVSLLPTNSVTTLDFNTKLISNQIPILNLYHRDAIERIARAKGWTFERSFNEILDDGLLRYFGEDSCGQDLGAEL